ncbi:hypothetical protein ACUIAK_07625 [Bacillus cytotoxicus]
MQNYLVINKTTFGTSVYECETQEEVKEIVSQLIEKGGTSSVYSRYERNTS